MTSYSPGDRAIWTGLDGRFRQPCRIIAARMSYLAVLGETPEDGIPVYDIDASPRIKGTLYSIPAGQLHPAD